MNASKKIWNGAAQTVHVTTGRTTITAWGARVPVLACGSKITKVYQPVKDDEPVTCSKCPSA